MLDTDFNKYLFLFNQFVSESYLDELKAPITLSPKQITFLNRTVKNQKRIISILDHHTRKYLYISDNLEEIAGINHELLKRFGCDFFTEHILHPDDVSMITSTVKVAKEFITNKEYKEDVLNMSYIFNMRIVNSKNKILHLLYKGSLLEVSENYYVELGFTFDISHWKKSIQHYLFIKAEVNDILFVCDPESLVVEEVKLSKAQMNVLSLLAKGNSVDEVAKTLFLSKHTIETHRKHILSKTKFNDTNELINFALEAELI